MKQIQQEIWDVTKQLSLYNYTQRKRRNPIQRHRKYFQQNHKRKFSPQKGKEKPPRCKRDTEHQIDKTGKEIPRVHIKHVQNKECILKATRKENQATQNGRQVHQNNFKIIV